MKTKVRKWSAAAVMAAATAAVSLSVLAQDLPGGNAGGYGHPGAVAQVPPGMPGIAGGPGGEKEGDDKKPDFPPFAEVSKDFEKVVSTADGQESLFTLWTREKDGQVLAELPRGFAQQKHFIAMTVAGGDPWAGLQAGDMYVYWKRFDKRMALMEPNVGTRSSGDQESKSGVDRLFTDRVILDVPIVCMGPNGQPVIDMDAMLVGQAGKFFGSDAGGSNNSLATIKKAKAFPGNVELAFEMPVNGGQLKTFHYSINLIQGSAGYQPRVADERLGYFTTTHRDLGKFREDEKWVRYVNRWNLEKADPKLKMSPPKEPIVFYVEHTVPVRYRSWVKQGAEYWNQAFAKVGIKDAVVVYFQDKTTGAHMDKDPEDRRYNFLRWLTNDMATAIGPSRVNPMTGEILDADIVLTDGWIRVFWYEANELLPQVAMEGFSPDTLAWLDRNPKWDPRLRLAPPGERDFILAQRAQRGVLRYGGHPAANADGSALLGGGEFDGLAARISQKSSLCMAAHGKAMDMALMGMNLEVMGLLGDETEKAAGDEPKAEGEKKDEPKKDEGDVLDGVPEWFIGPSLADLVAHEVGHTLGLRHNFRASGAYTLKEINSPAFKGQKPFTGSVMDYNPVNINMADGEVQGDYSMNNIGPYDMWVIEYGYTFGDPKEILKRVAEPELQYATDEDTWGPDPLARRYDFAAEPLDFANSRMKLVTDLRGRILDKFVKEGQSWSKARRGYSIALGQQVQMLNMMANWVGGAHVYRDKKGDPNGRPPIDVVPAAKQRAALAFVIDNSFNDAAFGLTPDLLKHMTVDKWWDQGGDYLSDPTWPIHDRVMGVQASVLTMLLNPTKLQRVYDNEFRIPGDQDAFTLPELMDTVSAAVWKELDSKPSSQTTARKPMVSSLRRNLQREHMERLVDLTMPGTMDSAAGRPISNLAAAELREIRARIGGLLDDANASKNVDPYSRAHLGELAARIDKALDAQYIYNAEDMRGSGTIRFLFGQEGEALPTGR